jgi:membrane-bound lytic murein transglycosylase D
MRSTGRQYLKIDAEVDERNDPLLATRAAAKKLRSNYEMLESWPLAVTAYNHGPYGIRRMVQKQNTRDIVELTDVRKGSFGFASASFYASFLAALEVEKNAKKYFGDVSIAAPMEGFELRLEKPLDQVKLLSWFDGDLEKAKDFNPHLASNFWKGYRLLKKGHMIRVPADKQMEAVSELQKYKAPLAALKEVETHRVERGETLSQIAEKYNVPTYKLMEFNSISKAKNLQAGQVLQIPAGGKP